MTPNKLNCPACNKEADTLVTHHWYELPNLIYHSKDICMSCNILLINKNFHLDTPDTINGLSSSQIGHILPDWGKQVKFIKDANEFYDSFNGELIYATCPKCSSTDIIKSGGRNIALKGGTTKKLRMYKCKKCGYQFSEQTMFNKLLTPNTRQKLTDMVKPNQSASDVFEELITAALSQEIKDKLETFRKHPRETPEDLINSLLDELEAIQKELERIEVVRKQIEPPDNLDDALTLIAILTYDKEELKKQLNNKEN